MLVSHDRDFLDRTINRVVEIEAETRRVHEYSGTWSEYEAARERARAQHEAAYADYLDEKRRYTTLLEDRRRQAHTLGAERKLARQTGGADRRATNALRGKVNQARNHLERLEEVEKPWTPWRLQMEFAAAPPTGTIAELAGAVVEVGSFTLGPVDLALQFSDRLAVVGANGAGQDDADPRAHRRAAARPRLAARRAGGRLRRADPGARPLLRRAARRLRPAVGPHDDRCAHLLAKFALGPDDITRPAPSLSPGERTRAGLALLSARGVNCLILDEPTNHLDLEAIEELETALETYEGCLVVVTHDRRFLSRLAVTRTMEL